MQKQMTELHADESLGISTTALNEILALFPSAPEVSVTLSETDSGICASAGSVRTEVSTRENSAAKTAKLALYDLLTALTGEKKAWGTMTGVKPLKKYQSLYLQGMTEQQADRYFIDNYRISPQKLSLLKEIFRLQMPYLFPEKDSVCLYINIPLCPAKCTYCSFPTLTVSEGDSRCGQYLDVLISELQHLSEFIENSAMKVIAVYFGGGTPSVLSLSQTEKLFLSVSRHIGSRTEVTFEAGRADTLSKEKLRLLKELGANRISLNPQTANETTLKLAGRNIPYSEFLSVYEKADAAGFGNINCDLIFGFENETSDDFSDSLNKTMSLMPGSITLHTLCKKHASQLDIKAINSSVHDVSSYLSHAGGILSGAGYMPYYSYKQKYAVSGGENTGFCRKGHECVYNIFMMNDRCDILAAGAGSSSKLIGAGTKTYHIFNPKDYLLYTNSPQEVISKKMKSLEDAQRNRLSSGR